MRWTSLRNSHLGKSPYFAGKLVFGALFCETALIFSPVGFVVVVIMEIVSIPVSTITAVSRFRFSATGFSMACLLQEIPLSATVVVGTGFLNARVPEIRSATGVYGELRRLLLHDAFVFDGCCLL